MDKFAIKIIKNGIISAIFSTGEESDWTILDALKYVLLMLENYNINLCNVKLEDPLFAIRFLDIDNEEGTKCKPQNKCIIRDESRNYIEKIYPYFNIEESSFHSADCGYVSITSEDIVREIDKATFIVRIDLDEHLLKFSGFYREMSLEDWENDDETSGSLFTEDLEVSPFDFFNLPFNYLHEFYSFVTCNINGWVNAKKRDVVIVPISYN